MSRILGPSTKHPRRTRRLGLLGVALATGLSGTVAVIGTAGTASAETTSQYGAMSSASGLLPPSDQCGTYSYRYDLDPPAGNWALETTVIDPRGNAVSSYTVLSGYSAGGAHASTDYQLCRNNTAAGIFTITGKLTTTVDGGKTVSTYEMTPATFQLTDASVVQQAKQKKHKHKKHAKKKNKKNR